MSLLTNVANVLLLVNIFDFINLHALNIVFQVLFIVFTLIEI